MEKLYIINNLGERELFSLKKITNSLYRAGVPASLAKEIAAIVEEEVYPGITTKEIYRKTQDILIKEYPLGGIRFNLKEAMRKLGPTGFSFEKFIGAIFSDKGFKVKLNQQIPGSCITYEIDFTAQKENLFYIGECKYRNLPGDKVHSGDALINYARFLDIKKGNFFNRFNQENLEIKSLLVTNTKFTDRAVKYSKCVGVEILGWNYPKQKGLEYLIESQRLYPITILPSLRRGLAEVFAEKKMMLVQDLLKTDIKKLEKMIRIPQKYLIPLIKEANILLESKYDL